MATTTSSSSSSGRVRRRTAATTLPGATEAEAKAEAVTTTTHGNGKEEIRWNGRNDPGTVKGDLMVWNYRGSTIVEVFDQSTRPSSWLILLILGLCV